MTQDLAEVSPLSGQGTSQTPIRSITVRPSLPPPSLTPSSTGTPLRVTFHLHVETVGLTTFHTSTTPGGVRLRLSAGGATSARGVRVSPLPGHVPFGSSLSASLACCLLRRLNSGSPELAIPSNPSSRPPARLAVAASPRGSAAGPNGPRLHCPGSSAPQGYPRRTSRYGTGGRTPDRP